VNREIAARVGTAEASKNARAEPERVRVLIVDDRAAQLTALEAVLEDPQIELVKVRSGRAALRELLRQDFAAILLDVNMPGMDGFETAAMIRQRPRCADTPILFVTSMTDTETHASRGYLLGAVDYIHAPIEPEVLRTKVHVFVELYRKTAEVRRQAEELRELEAREHRRVLDDAMARLDSESKRNLFFMLSVDMLCIAGFDGYIKQLNPAWEKVLGHDEQTLRSSPLITFVHPEDRAETLGHLDELRQGAYLSYFENRFAVADGSYRWLGWTAAPYPVDQHLYMIARDISERKRVEEEHEGRLVEERQRASQLLKLTAASLAINSARSIEEILQNTADQAREILEVERVTARLVTDPGGTLVGPRRMGCTSPRDAVQDWLSSQLLARATELNEPLCLTPAELAKHPDLGPLAAGLEPGGWLSVPLTGRDGRAIGMIQLSDGRSFTHEDELLLLQLAQGVSVTLENALYIEAREANRLKDEFLAMLSHELRTPLNAMLGWTQLLRIGNLGADETARALEIIERNVRTQAQLIEDLLDVSRITTGKLRLVPAPIEFAPVVANALDALRPEAEGKRIRLEAQLDQRGRVHGDPERLQQVVWNLVSNAIKFTPEGGLVQVGLRRLNGMFELTVRDNGEGIAPELLPHVFERFRQEENHTGRGHGGLGLGLTLVRHLVELHGGSVAAHSEGKSRGSLFTVRLQAADGIASSEGDASFGIAARFNASEADAAPRLDGLHVLVVEDQAESRDFVATALENHGAEVMAVSSCAEALAALDRFPADLLISDIAMPKEDGYTLIRRVRDRPADRGGNVPAMAVTAHASEQDGALALESGFQLHLVKPIVLPMLVRAAVALTRGRVAPPNGVGAG
jgi:PAS domain S-box-containing protein